MYTIASVIRYIPYIVSVIHYVPFAEGSETVNFINVIQNPLESWLDSKIPESILVIPVYQIRACISRDS